MSSPTRTGARNGSASGNGFRARLRRHPLLWLAATAVVVLAAALLARTLLPPGGIGYTVQRRNVVQTLVLTGRVRAPSRAGLGATVAGTVDSVAVDAGDTIRAGQLLVRLDDREPRAAVAQARATLAATRAEARSAVDQAQLSLGQAARQLRRARALFAQGAISRSDLEQAQDAADEARTRLAAARARVDNGAGDEPAAVQAARAVLAAAEARLALTRVTAPAAGVVLGRHVEPGDAVQPGQVLLDVALDGPTELIAFPAEENLRDLRVGAPATASADAFPGQTFAARITRIAPAVDPSQGTVEVRLAVAAPPAYLRPDMTVSVNVDVARRDSALVVPFDAVRAPLTDTAWVARLRGGRVQRRGVRLGVRGERFVEVRSGLQLGDTVLAADVPATPGHRVRARIAR